MTTKKYSIFYTIRRACAIYFKASKGRVVLEQVIAVLRALSFVAILIATQRLFNSILQISRGEAYYSQIIIAIIVLVIITIIQDVLSGAESYLQSELSYRNVRIIMVEFHQKLKRLSAKRFENTDFLDDLNRAKDFIEDEELCDFAHAFLNMFSYYIVFFVSISLFLFSLSPILPLIIIIAFIPAIIGHIFQIKLFEELEEENSPLRRQTDYYQSAIVDKRFFKETRLLGGFNYFYCHFAQIYRNFLENKWAVKLKASLLRTLLSVIAFIGLGGSLFLLFITTMNGDISVGDFVAVLAALIQIFHVMDEIVNERLSESSESLGQLANYYSIMDMDEVNGEKRALDFSKGISAKDLNFAYPNRTNSAIKHVSISIKNKETIAIVGENGAGKSTLARLLIGLYLPDEGVVNIGGTDSTSTHPESIYEKISGVFQNFQHYKMTLQNNVAISKTDSPVETDLVSRVLNMAHFNENSASLNTMLSPEFDGIDISGGQWQRVAIARGLYRGHDFILLDEPTSAIDPIEEAYVYSRFKRLAEEKCAIIITHRLASVKLAARIIVMDNGEIVESGTHDDLIAKCGKYAEMWEAQAKWYG